MLPLFINKANNVKGIDAIAAIIIVTRIDVGSYGALMSGRKGIGNSTHSQRPTTIASSFHLFLILCFRNDVPVGDAMISALMIKQCNISHDLTLLSLNLLPAYL